MLGSISAPIARAEGGQVETFTIRGSLAPGLEVWFTTTYVATRDSWWCRRNNWLEGVSSAKSFVKRYPIVAQGGQYQVVVNPAADLGTGSYCAYELSSIDYSVILVGQDKDGVVQHAMFQFGEGASPHPAGVEVSCRVEPLSELAGGGEFVRCEHRVVQAAPGATSSEASVSFTLDGS